MGSSDERVLHWLLEAEQPSVRYLALVHLLERPETDPEVSEARRAIARRGWVKDILAEERPDGHWAPDEQGLYRPKYLATNWRMLVLSDMGLFGSEPEVKAGLSLYVREWLASDRLLKEDKEVCVLGNFARALTNLGMGEDERVQRIFDWLVEDQKDDGGWHCDHESKTGTLDCWEALAAFNALPRGAWSRKMKRSVERGAEFYLERGLWKEGRRYEPWFRFHYPIHYYYDILVGLDVTTALGYGGDNRLGHALKILEDKRRDDGTWNLDAIHPDMGPGAGYRLKTKPIEFALERKGRPSKWITLTCLRVLKRVGEA